VLDIRENLELARPNIYAIGIAFSVEVQA